MNNFPDIDFNNSDENPTISSPSSTFEISFYQTRESLMDIELYKSFLDNAILRFRQSETYKNYKSFLMELGLDRCQFNSNINSEMASIEMHHNMFTIFDIAIILTEYTLNKSGKISTFDLVEFLKTEHIENRVMLVMLSRTSHQLFHDNQNFFIHPDMCFGNWVEFIRLYKSGITRDIAYKILYYLKNAIDKGNSDSDKYLNLYDEILSWS